MPPLPLRTAIPFGPDRTAPASLAVDFAKMMEASGAVDQFLAWDQLVSWWPKALWTPENTFLAEVSGDPDSFNDAFMLAAIAAATTTNLGIGVTTDAVRRGPAELMQARFPSTTEMAFLSQLCRICPKTIRMPASLLHSKPG